MKSRLEKVSTRLSVGFPATSIGLGGLVSIGRVDITGWVLLKVVEVKEPFKNCIGEEL